MQTKMKNKLFFNSLRQVIKELQDEPYTSERVGLAKAALGFVDELEKQGLNNGLYNWSEKNGWCYNFCDNKWWQHQESGNYIKKTTKELAKLCLKETT